MTKKLYLGLLLLSISLLAAPRVTEAATIYNLNVDSCTGGCSAVPGSTLATVTVSQVALNQVSLTVAFTSPSSQFVKTGAGDSLAFTFNATGPAVSLVGSITSGAPNPTLTLVIPGITNSNFGNFNYGISCAACGNGGAGAFAGPLAFTLTAAGLTEASFATLSTGGAAMGNQFFAVDMLGPNGNTGVVAGSTGQVPEPATLLTAGISILAFGILRRKIQKN